MPAAGVSSQYNNMQQPQAVRAAGSALFNFFTSIGTNNYNLYQTAVQQYAEYFPDHVNSPDSYVDGQAQGVFNALKQKLKVAPGADLHSIFKVGGLPHFLNTDSA
jgi:hypothetical protein